MQENETQTENIKEISKEEFIVALDLFGITTQENEHNKKVQSSSKGAFDNLLEQIEDTDNLVS